MTGIDFPNISPIVFAVGPLAIRWYSLAYLFGLLLGWFLLNRNVKKNNLSLTKEDTENLIFYITVGIILGGRLGYAMFYGGAQMWLEPWKLLEIWKGGMSFHGGVVGVILAIYLFAKKIKYDFLSLTDVVVLYVPIGIFLGRLANFVNDELWGRVTTVDWAVKFPSGGYLPRHPSQLYEAFFEGLVMFAVLNLLWCYKPIRSKKGFASGLFVLLYGVFRMSMEQFREPDAQLGYLYFNATMGQLLSIPMVLVGLFVIWKSFKKV